MDRIVALAGNQALLETSQEVHRQIHLARSRSGHVSQRAKEALEEHHEVLENLEKGRGEEAVIVLTNHLRHSLASALEVLEADANADGAPRTS